MAEVVLDPDTRAPSPAWQKIARFVGAFLAMKLALWVAPLGLALTAEDQLWVATGFAMLAGAVGTEARDRGWPVLRLLFVLPLALGLSGCAWLGLGETTPAKAWSVALTSYESAARGMAAWCAQPEATREPCVAAANATKTADLVILSTEDKLKTGSIQDAELAAATSTIKAVLPLLARAAGGQ